MSATTLSELDALKRIKFNDLDTWHLKALRRRLEWLEMARPDQLPPEDGWVLWILMAGRGTGKTRTAAEHTWFRGSWYARIRWLVGAPTSSDLRDTCFEGESGIMVQIPGEFVKKYNRSLSELELKNGSLVKGIPLFEPDRQRGPQWHGAWVDELAAAEKNKVEESWKNLTLAVRLPGLNAEKVITTTPKPIPLMMSLVKRKGVVITRAATYDNLHNLEDQFKEEVLKFEGTNYGKQEILGELLNPEEAGIIKRSWFKLWKYKDKNGKVQRLPRFKLIVQSYDTAFGEKQTKNEDNTACVVFGVFEPDPKNKKGENAVMIVDAWQDKINYPTMRDKVHEDFAKARYGETDDGMRPTVLLIEQKSSGISVIQDLNSQGVPALGYNPGKLDKYQRLQLVAYLPKHGLVWLPESIHDDKRGQPRAWADLGSDVLGSEGLLTTLCLFPQVRHDDFVDAFGQGLQYLADQGYIKVKNLHLPPPKNEKDYYAEKKRRTNPYMR